MWRSGFVGHFSKASRPVETKLKASGVGSGPQPLIASETDEAPRARCSVPPPTAENGGIEYGGLPVGLLSLVSDKDRATQLR